MKYTLNRDYTLASVNGHPIEFKKGVATHVPPRVKAEAIAIGALPAEEEDEPEVKKVEIPEGEDRVLLIRTAMEDMAAANVREEFTAAGTPHNKVLSERVGFTVSAQERDKLWAELKAGK
jgi:hypothetical protein